MLTENIKERQARFLKKFTVGRDMPELKDQDEKRFFRELQQYDLIRVGPAGKFRITTNGRYALGVGVRKYITNIRLERKLLMDYVRSKSRTPWLILFGIIIFILLLSLFTLFFGESTDIF